MLDLRRTCAGAGAGISGRPRASRSSLRGAGEPAAEGAVGEAVAGGDEDRAGEGVAERDGQQVLQEHGLPRDARRPQREALQRGGASGGVEGWGVELMWGRGVMRRGRRREGEGRGKRGGVRERGSSLQLVGVAVSCLLPDWCYC
jgi:hypothetical protein